MFTTTIRSFFRSFVNGPKYDPYIEGVYADQYHEPLRTTIRQEYQQRYTLSEPTPLTAPHLFDPCEPPAGWRYDPYYELWIEE
jgi:hypothetical protein